MTSESAYRGRPQRRSVATKKVSYKEEPIVDDDEEEEKAKLSQYFDDSSGSDFEKEVVAVGKAATLPSSDDEASSGVDSEEVEAEEEKVLKKSSKKTVPPKMTKIPKEYQMPKKLSPAAKLAKMRRENLVKNGAKSGTQKAVDNRKYSKMDSLVKNEDKTLTGNFGQFRSNVAAKSDLNLSESSSDDEESELTNKVKVIEQPRHALVSTLPKIKPVVSSSDDDEEMASQLVNLVTSYSQASEVMKQNASRHMQNKKMELKSLSDEDDSGDDGNHHSPKKRTKLSRSANKKLNAGPSTVKVEKEESDEDGMMASQLENLANFQSKVPDFAVKTETPRSVKKSSKKNRSKHTSDNQGSIKDLLAMGEGIEMGDSDEEDSSSDDDDKKVAQASQIPSGGIEINLEVPSHQRKKKKGFDVEAYLKREMAKVQREIQMSVHQVHILCLVAHLRHLNRYTTPYPRVGHSSTDISLGLALSVVPPIHAISAEKLNMVSLAAFVHWFRDSFPIVSCSKNEVATSNKKIFPNPFEKWLQRCFENYVCESREQLVIAFITAARALGWNTRIVLNFETAPLKPGKSQSDSNSNEDSGDGEKESKDVKPKPGCSREAESKKSSTSRSKKEDKAEDSPEKKEKASHKASQKRKSSDADEISVKSKKLKESQKSEGERKRKSTSKTTETLDKKSSEKRSERDRSKSSSRKTKEESDEKHKLSKIPKKDIEDVSRRKSDVSTERQKSKSKSSSKNEEDNDIALSRKLKMRKEDSASKLTDRALREAMVRTKSSRNQQRPIICKSSASESDDDEKNLAETSKLKRLSKTSKLKDEKSSSGASKLKNDVKSSEKQKTSPSRSKSDDTKIVSKSSKSAKNKNDEREKSSLKDEKSPAKSSKNAGKTPKAEDEKNVAKTSRRSSSVRVKKQDSDSDFEDSEKFHSSSQKSRKSESLPQKKITKVNAKPPGKIVCYWAEVLTPTHGWITVDVTHGRINCTSEMESMCSKPILYIVACNMDGTVKDLTKKYVSPSTYLIQTRKARISQEWLDGIFIPLKPRATPEDKVENERIEKHLLTAPMPTTVSGFKGHPLFVLSRHLLKFEAIYPENAPTLGFIRGEAVYARDCVHTLHCRVTWLKEGRTVKLGEEPYKIVKARPKWDRMNGTVVKDQPLEVFGRWQTEIYIPPPAKDGKVPRNEYGNVELFKPWMLPKGTTHIPIVGLNRVAKKLNIDCAPAMVGWEFSGGGCHPVFDGFVVCSELAETLLDAWNVDVEERAKKEAEKKEKRALDNWKKLIKGMLMHQKIRNKYLGKETK